MVEGDEGAGLTIRRHAGALIRRMVGGKSMMEGEARRYAVDEGKVAGKSTSGREAPGALTTEKRSQEGVSWKEIAGALAVDEKRGRRKGRAGIGGICLKLDAGRKVGTKTDSSREESVLELGGGQKVGAKTD